MKLYKTLQNFTVTIVMVFLVLTSASCSNMTKEQDMTTLYEKLKGGDGGVALFENLTPNEIDAKMTGVTANSIQLSKLKAGSVFIFKGTSIAGDYYGKALVTKVESGKFEFRFVLYQANKSVAEEKEEGLAKRGDENLGTVTDGVTPVGNTAMIRIRMNINGKIEVIPTGGTAAKMLLLN